FSQTPTPITTKVIGSSTISMAPVNSSVSYGQPVTFIAAIASAVPSNVQPSGPIFFFVDGQWSGPVAINSRDQAAFTLFNAAPGAHYAQVAYYGDGNFNSYTTPQPIGVSVVKANTSLTLGSTANSLVVGQSVAFTAAVAPVAPGAGMPTGFVTFYIDG